MANIAIIGSEKSGRTSLGEKLGKKGTESDITLYNFVKGEKVFAFVEANGYPDSLKSLINAINLCDIALVCVPSGGINAQIGECIVALDLIGNKRGLFVITMSDLSNPAAISELSERIKAITRGTNLEKWESVAVSTTTFKGLENLREKIFALDKDVRAANASKKDLPPRVAVDHFFNVTGIGCVVLGVVTQGTIRQHDKLTLFPVNRPVEIRSIQSHDVDIKHASAGTRVGLALKGVQSKEFNRGYILSQKEEISSKLNLKCKLTKFTPGLCTGDVVHLFAGLQSVPATVTSIAVNGSDVAQVPPGSDCTAVLTTQKEIVYSRSDYFLIAQLNTPKQRFVAGCEVLK